MRNDRSKKAGFQDWETPPKLFKMLDKEFNFNLDLAATKKTALCKRFFSPEEDGLKQSWGKSRCFVNPPFKLTRHFMQKAAEEKKATVVALVLASVDTKWWYTSVMGEASEIRFIKGRISFYRDGVIPRVGPKGKFSTLRAGACIIIFRPRTGKVKTRVSWGITYPGQPRVDSWE